MDRPHAIGEPDFHLATDSETWLGFLAKEHSLVWALIRRKIQVKGSPRLLRAFGQCFPTERPVDSKMTPPLAEVPARRDWSSPGHLSLDKSFSSNRRLT